MPEEEPILALPKLKEKFARENLMGMDPDLLEAVIRGRTYHTLNLTLCRIFQGLETALDTLGDTVKGLIDIWKERQLPMDQPDLKWIIRLLEIAEDLKQGKKPTIETELAKPFPKEELQAVEKVILTRRSVRNWTKNNVPRWMLEKLVQAAQWAPSSCNTQTVRIKIVDDEEGLKLFRKWPATRAKVIFVFCQDMRPYEFFPFIEVDNYRHDIGAAVQNMLLMAHALGLGAVCLTFVGKEQEMIRKHYNIPDYFKIATYVALGWPGESPLPPGRIKLEKAII